MIKLVEIYIIPCGVMELSEDNLNHKDKIITKNKFISII